MLIKLDQPRLLLSAQDYPQNLVLYCLSCDGFEGTLSVKERENNTLVVPNRELSVMFDMILREYVLSPRFLTRDIIRKGSSLGIDLEGSSSFRASNSTYGFRTFQTTLMFPSNGGGILRMSVGNQEWDILNPTFNPRAEIPAIGEDRVLDFGVQVNTVRTKLPPEDHLRIAYQRTHVGYSSLGKSNLEEEEARRQERIANFDLEEVDSKKRSEEVSIEVLESTLRGRRGPLPRPPIPTATQEVSPPETTSRFDRMDHE